MKRFLTSLFIIAALLLPAPVQAEVQVLEWKIWPVTVTTSNLYSISMLNASDGWAVGANGVSLHWNGTQWESVPTGVLTTLRSVDCFSSNECWAVGDGGTFLHWNGLLWQHDESSDGTGSFSMRSVNMITPTHIWAVGDWQLQPRLQHHNEKRWENWEMPQENLPNAISAIDDEVGWIVGDNGAILMKALGDWVPAISPVTTRLNAVLTISASNAWAAGDNGVILHRTTGGWVVQNTPTQASLKSIEFTPTAKLWAVGSGGAILYWNGAQWSSVSSPTANNLNGISMVNDSNGWAVGDGGVILRYNPQNPAPALASLSPAVMPAGANGGVLLVNGSGFVTNSVVLWDGNALPTTYIDDMQLKAQVPPDELVSVGQGVVTVSSPGPGGGTSSSLICEVVDLPHAIFLPLIIDR
ncbi:MAG TPA: hypothetical protein PKW33_12910 [Anaerolineaceae bacterium]|nr:hypothetical protein [Anaerolineaceae bacterium]HPN52483.1 hypothetical protein [Anaerolineaceae bacterium]